MSVPSSLPNLGKTSREKFCFLSGIAQKRGGVQWANLDKSKSIQFYQTNVTNVAKILLLQVFLNIRRKLFDFQTFMNQTHIINSTDIIIYFTDTYYLYYVPSNVNTARLLLIFRSLMNVPRFFALLSMEHRQRHNGPKHELH